MALKSNKKKRKIKVNKNANKTVYKRTGSVKSSRKNKKTVDKSFQVQVLAKSFFSNLFNIFKSLIRTTIISLQNLIKAPFLFINVFSTNLLIFFKGFFTLIFEILKKILTIIVSFKSFFWSILFSILSGSIGAVIAISFIELNSDVEKNNLEILQYYEKVSTQLKLLEERLEESEKDNEKNKMVLNDLKPIQKEVYASEQKFTELGDNINNLRNSLENVEKETIALEQSISLLKKDLKSNSRLILSSSKTELSNRLYLAQSLLDRLESGVPYSPQLEALGKEGLDPALLRFAAGGAPTLKDLEARLSARAGEQLDADRTKKDNTWRENLKKEISKYVKIKPTNINDIKGVTGALLRAEQSLSRGDLTKAINEISSVPPKERGPLDAWLTEATARQNADIAAKNLLAKTTAALQQKN